MPNPGPASTISPHQLLQADSSDGYLFGTLSSTPIGMYGVTPVAQRSNAAQLSVSSAATAGTLVSLNTIGISGAGVGINTTLSMTFNITGGGVMTSDFLGIINKPTSQVGLGIANARTQTATNGQIVVQYFNMSGSTITPTANESYGVALFRGMAQSLALSPAPVPANTAAEQIFNVTGIAVGELVMVAKATEQLGVGIAGMRAAGNNQLGITFLNNSSAPITPSASETYTYLATGGLAANSNIMVYGVNVGTQLPAVVTASTNTWVVQDQSVTCNSIQATDIWIGGTKPGAQAQLALVAGRITAANTVQLQLATGSITGVTPTASEVYSVTLYRQNPAAPIAVVTATVAPTAIAGNTTAEQAFTVTPLPTNGLVWVNKPTATGNIGIIGCRISAAGVVGITFVNAAVSTTITPPTEIYTFGVVQPAPSGGSAVLMSVANGLIGTNQQSQELRNALVALGPITGGTP